MRAAAGSAHHRPKKALSSNPESRMADRYVACGRFRSRPVPGSPSSSSSRKMEGKEKQAEFKADSGNGGDDFARVDTFRPRGIHFGRNVIVGLSRSDAGVKERCCCNQG
jgi:hypothetical protein